MKGKPSRKRALTRDEKMDAMRDGARDAERDQTGDEAWDDAFFPELVEYWDEIRGDEPGVANDAERDKP